MKPKRRLVTVAAVVTCLLCLDAKVWPATKPPAPLARELPPGKMPKEPWHPADNTIPLEPMGYSNPNPMLLTQRLTWMGMGFVDNNTLLITFHAAGLLRRDSHPEQRGGQTIHAVVVDIATGRIKQDADWQMPDRGRYLWHLRNGMYLVRVGGQLYRTNADLKLVPFLKFEDPLEALAIEPAGTLVVTQVNQLDPEQPRETPLGDGESKTAPSLMAEPKSKAGAAAAPPDTRPRHTLLQIIRADDGVTIGHASPRAPVELPLSSQGFWEALEGRKQGLWQLMFQTFGQEHPRPIVEMKSVCRPYLYTLSTRIALVNTCTGNGGERLATGLDTDGKMLWSRISDSQRVWPSLQIATSGTRYASASIILKHPVSALDPIYAEDIVGQVIEVFDSETGLEPMLVPASPPMDAGDNFALSADGSKLAVVRNNQVEIYNLPERVTAEQDRDKKQ